MALPITELATVTPQPMEPFWTVAESDRTITQAIYKYTATQQTWRRWFPWDNKGKGGKRVLPYTLVDEKWENEAGDDPWPLFTPVPIEGFEDKWILETEGEKCALILVEHGFAAISQPGCKHSPELIADRYDALYGKVRGVIYLADNDLEGTRKAHRCRDAAASVELDFIHVDMAVVFEDLPLKGSIDDVPDVPAAVQKIVDSLPSQLPAQVDYDDEPEPVIPGDPEESTAQADLPQGNGRDAFTLERLVPGQLGSSLKFLSKPLMTDDLTTTLFYLAAMSGLLKIGSNVQATIDWIVAAAMWVICVAKTGVGKTPIFKELCFLPMAKIAQQDAAEYKSEAAHYKAQRPKERSPVEPRQYFPHVQKFSAAAMDRQLQWHEEAKRGLLILVNELEGLFQSIDADGRSGSGEASTQLLDMFNNVGSNTLRASTDNRTWQTSHIAVVGFTQPSKLRKRIGGEDDDGRWARFLNLLLPRGIMRCTRGKISPEAEAEIKRHRKVLADFAEAVFKLPVKTYKLAYEAQDRFCDWAEGYRLKADLDATDPVLAAFYNKVGDHALRLIGMLHLAQEFDLDAARAGKWRPSDTIAVAVIELALEIMDLIVKETEAFHADDSDLVDQLIAKVKASPAIDWKWSAIKGSCNQAIRKGGFELWKTAVFQMRESGIGEVTKSKPLTFRRHTDVDGHRKMSA